MKAGASGGIAIAEFQFSLVACTFFWCSRFFFKKSALQILGGAEETGTGGGGREIEGAIAGDGRVRRPTPVYGGGGAFER